MDNDESDYLNEDYIVEEYNLPVVFNKFKQDSKLFCDYPTEELCNIFKKLVNKNDDGTYPFSYEIIKKMEDYCLTETLVTLTKDGLVEPIWNDDDNDFRYALTDLGKKVADEMIKRELSD